MASPGNRLELPRRGGLKKAVAHTFSPFGPILPGSPGGPYAIKIRNEKVPSKQGRMGGEGSVTKREALGALGSSSSMVPSSRLGAPRSP